MFAAGVLLVVLGAALAAAEAHVPTSGALGAGAVAATAVGAGLMVSAAGSTLLIAVLTALLLGLAGAGLTYVLVRNGLATRRLAVSNSLIGRQGVARAADSVFVDGALWRARLWELDDGVELARGDPVVVEQVDGLTLTVRPAEEWER